MNLLTMKRMNVVEPNAIEMDMFLVQQIAQGNKEAFQLLFNRYETPIYRFCLFLIGNADIAQDIYQETFFGFYQACRERKEIRNVHGWLISKARSLCLNHLRDSKRRTELLQQQETNEVTDINVEEIDVEEHLQQALLEIPTHYREALLLFEVEGYSYKEIEAYLGVDFHTVKNRIYQAKRALQKILGPILKGTAHDGT